MVSGWPLPRLVQPQWSPPPNGGSTTTTNQTRIQLNQPQWSPRRTGGSGACWTRARSS
jgi:hypothetical protein